MKVAYVFNSPRSASYKLGRMILPQLEAGTHGVDVVGMFFFDDNVFVLRRGDPIGERLAKVAARTGTLLMMCDMCALERGVGRRGASLVRRGGPGAAPRPASAASRTLCHGAQVGCFPRPLRRPRPATCRDQGNPL